MNKVKLYVKAIDANRYAGGSHNWLWIRDLEKTKQGYTIKVKIKWGIRYIDCLKNMETPNLIFKTYYDEPILFRNVVKSFLTNS